MADCIKVAVDFVSPENVRRCEILTREFREQNQAQAWKEDVLQLRTMMWYAWLSCERLEQLRAGKAREPSTCSNPLEQRA
jgi:[histone H3]-dimethyl-L-lysine9 demethylase